MRTLRCVIALVARSRRCASSTAPDPGLEGLALTSVAPGTIIPGTKIVVAGDVVRRRSVGRGHAAPRRHGRRPSIDVAWPAKFVDFEHDDRRDRRRASSTQVGGDVDFDGTATVEVVATSDGKTYSSEPLTTDAVVPQQADADADRHRRRRASSSTTRSRSTATASCSAATRARRSRAISGCFTARRAAAAARRSRRRTSPMVPARARCRARRRSSRSRRSSPASSPGTFTGKITIVNKQTAQRRGRRRRRSTSATRW